METLFVGFSYVFCVISLYSDFIDQTHVEQEEDSSHKSATTHAGNVFFCDENRMFIKHKCFSLRPQTPTRPPFSIVTVCSRILKLF